MSETVNYYDVERMIRDAKTDLRAEIREAIRESRSAIDELREMIGAERVERQDAIEALRQ